MILSKMKSLEIHELLTDRIDKSYCSTLIQNQNYYTIKTMKPSRDLAYLYDMATLFFVAASALSLPNDFNTVGH